MTECQEPGCRVPATKDWNGRLVCEDHYDFHRDQHEKMLMDLNG